jgi:hypothetical protein
MQIDELEEQLEAAKKPAPAQSASEGGGRVIKPHNKHRQMPDNRRPA